MSVKVVSWVSLASLLFLFSQILSAQNEAQLGSWSDPIPFGIVPVAVANLPDGRLICWSSQFRNTFRDSGDGTTFTEIFDPTLGLDGMALGETLTQTNHDMFCPGINNLPDGRILSAGGTSSEKTSIFDWRTGLWSPSDDMNIPRGYQGNVTLANGDVFTIGGSWSGGTWGNRDAEIWNRITGWSNLSNVKGNDIYTSNDLSLDPEGLYRVDNHAWLWVAPDGSVFHAGPSEQMNWINTDGNGSVVPAGLRSSDSYSMKGTTVMFDVGKILKVGGSESYASNTPAKSNSFVIDINGGYGTIPNITTTTNQLTYSRTMHNSTVLPDGKVLVTGGLDHAEVFTDSGARMTAELYDPSNNSWRLVAGMQVPRTYHSVAILLVDGRVFVGGGGLCTNFSETCENHFNAEIYSPPYLFDSNGDLASRPTISAPESAYYNSSLQVSGSAGIQQFSVVRMSSATHSTNNEQRRIPLDFNSSGNQYTVSVPDKNLLPPGYYMLFGLDQNGVPSVAEIIRIDEDVNTNQTPADLLVELDFEETSGTTLNDNTVYGNSFTVIERTDEGLPTVANDHSLGAEGVFGNAIALDGKYHNSNTILETPYNANLVEISSGLTVMAWVYRNSSSIVEQTGRVANVSVFAHNYPAMFAGFHNSLLKWSFGTSNGFTDCYAGYAPLDKWVHIAVTYDGQMARLYSNGVEICNSPITGLLNLRNDTNVRSNFTISGFYEHRTDLPVVPFGNRSGITDELDGRLDEFKLFNRPLASNEIKAYYDAGLATGNPDISNCNDNLLVAEYRVDNGDWIQGNFITAPLGSRVFIRAKDYNGEYYITTPQYDGPTFNTVEDSNRLTPDGAYQIDTHVQRFNYFRWGNPDRGNGLLDESNVGQFVLTTTEGCPTVIDVNIGSLSGLPPVANAGSDQTLADNDNNGIESVFLSGLASTDEDGTIVDFKWYEDGIEFATGAEVNTEFTLGTHDITLEVTDNSGLTSSDNVQITVISPNEQTCPADLLNMESGISFGPSVIAAGADMVVGGLSFSPDAASCGIEL
ncbi:galactose oxidase-like domain-containing protein, partial [Croceitalea dokdonensis]|uniref:galactose oxidase-like domain-containing protein n=1 Tax=Croceitalea dokdonensis TaxID=346188 RepID=UPI0006C9EE6A